MAGILVLALTLVIAAAIGLVLRVRDGRLHAGSEYSSRDDGGDDLRPVLADLGAEPGPCATLVQFSTAFCQPCRATRVLLADVAATVEGVHYVEVDAEAHLELVRRLSVRRTPTVLVLDRHGQEVGRASGQPPSRAAVLAAVGAVG